MPRIRPARSSNPDAVALRSTARRLWRARRTRPHARRPPPWRGRRNRANCGVVAVDDGGAACLKSAEISALASAIASSAGEEFEMHRLDGGDDRHMRAGQSGQRLDFAGVVHAHFEARHTRTRPDSAPATAARPNDCCRTPPTRGFRPRVDSASRSASLVPVLPTEPVTPITLAARARPRRGERARAARRARRAPIRSGASFGIVALARRR